jgi:RHS repeat-associated protein
MTSRDTPADGNLPLQGDPGSVTLYLPGEQLTATTVNGTTTVTGARIIALPSGGDVVRTGSGSSYYFEVPDQQGTEELELNDTAQVPTWRQFTPYGAPRGETVTWADNRGFLNQPTDPDTGLTYDGARAYDPVTARFISPDPVLEVSDPQDLDPYDYAEDNPVTGSDPTGQLPVLTNGDGVPQPGQTAKVDAEAEANGYDNQLSGNGGGGYGSSSGYGAGGCGYAGLSCHQGILGSYVPGPAPVVTPAVVSPPPAPPRPKRVTVPKSVTGSGFCTGRLMQLGACPSESGAAGTTPAQVRQSFEGAGMVLASVIPVGDLFDALLGGEAAADAGEGSELAQAAKSCSPVLGGASFTAGTEVLLASGKAVPVDTVRPGEKVLATSTKTGKTSPETVTAVEVHHDTDLYDLTVKSGGKVSVIDTTSSHLFWDPYLHYWVTANKLSKGELLETPDGTLAVVDGAPRPRSTTAGCGTSPSPATTTTTSMFSLPRAVAIASTTLMPLRCWFTTAVAFRQLILLMTQMLWKGLPPVG